MYLSRRPPRNRSLVGFTLVELLVVIGIIAVLIGILLPSLSRARKQARLVQCESNMRQLGQAVHMYASSNKGSMLPTIIWGTAQPGGTGVSGFTDDSWGFLLVAGGYIPDPNLTPNGQTSTKTVFTCPEIRDRLLATNIPGVTIPANGNAHDGYDRRMSNVIQPGLIVDYGYGINGSTYLPSRDTTADPRYYTMASGSIAYDTYKSSGLRPIGSIPRAASFVLMFDGSEWNPQNNGGNRISGGRHGQFDESNPYGSGKTNILFVDGHVDTFNRADLPDITVSVNQFWGNSSQMRAQIPVYWNDTQALN